MSEIKELTCINCPLGCTVRVELEGSEIVSVTGNSCRRGEIYAKSEVINPVRTVTSSVKVKGGQTNVVSVKTGAPIEKGRIFDCVNAMKDIEVTAPVHIGDVICDDIAGTGAALVATSNVEAAE